MGDYFSAPANIGKNLGQANAQPDVEDYGMDEFDKRHFLDRKGAMLQ